MPSTAADDVERPGPTRKLADGVGSWGRDRRLGVLAEFRRRSGPIEPLPVPVRFGRYEVIEELGTGGFGTVYLARDGELSRPVAIKVPRRGLLHSLEQVEKFLDEARNAAGLCHPAIVGVSRRRPV